MTTESSLSQVKYPPGRHPNCLKNLKPFKSGENGNPHRPYPLKQQLEDALRRPLASPHQKAAAGKHLVYSTLQGALLREPTPFREVWDRIEGKLQDTPPVSVDNRQVNIYVTSEKSKELTENAGRRLLEGGK